jgi:hypothetical protein
MSDICQEGVVVARDKAKVKAENAVFGQLVRYLVARCGGPSAVARMAAIPGEPTGPTPQMIGGYADGQRTPRGWHMIRLLEALPASPHTFLKYAALVRQRPEKGPGSSVAGRLADGGPAVGGDRASSRLGLPGASSEDLRVLEGAVRAATIAKAVERALIEDEVHGEDLVTLLEGLADGLLKMKHKTASAEVAALARRVRAELKGKP